jgi:hypothetical protein
MRFIAKYIVIRCRLIITIFKAHLEYFWNKLVRLMLFIYAHEEPLSSFAIFFLFQFNIWLHISYPLGTTFFFSLVNPFFNFIKPANDRYRVLAWIIQFTIKQRNPPIENNKPDRIKAWAIARMTYISYRLSIG